MRRFVLAAALLLLLGTGAVALSSCGGGGGSATPTTGVITVGNEAGFNVRVYLNGTAAADLAQGASTSWTVQPGVYTLRACELADSSNCTTQSSYAVNAGQTTTMTFVAY